MRSNSTRTTSNRLDYHCTTSLANSPSIHSDNYIFVIVLRYRRILEDYNIEFRPLKIKKQSDNKCDRPLLKINEDYIHIMIV